MKYVAYGIAGLGLYTFACYQHSEGASLNWVVVPAAVGGAYLSDLGRALWDWAEKQTFWRPAILGVSIGSFVGTTATVAYLLAKTAAHG